MSLDKKYSNISDAQEAIDQLKNTLSEEGFRAMERGLEDLEASVQTSKMELIEAFKNDINATLEGEIIKRYFYREGMYTYFLATNNEVFKAQEIINDSELYKNILR